jgi:hypothetical protein
MTARDYHEAVTDWYTTAVQAHPIDSNLLANVAATLAVWDKLAAVEARLGQIAEALTPPQIVATVTTTTPTGMQDSW